MTSEVADLIYSLYHPELRGAQGSLRTSLHNGDAAQVERLRSEFTDFLLDRPTSSGDFYRSTSIWFANDDDLYRGAEAVYRFYFEDRAGARLHRREIGRELGLGGLGRGQRAKRVAW